MDDFDFAEELSFERVKLADGEAMRAFKETAKKRIVDPLKRSIPGAAASAAGMALMGGYGYYKARPGKDGAPSKYQAMAAADLANAEKLREQLKTEGREPTYSEGTALATAQAKKDLADNMAKHPVRGALHLAKSPGAMVGGAILGRMGLGAAKKISPALAAELKKFGSQEKTALDMASFQGMLANGAGAIKGLASKAAPVAQGMLAKAKANPVGAGALLGGGLGASHGLLADPGVDPRTGQKRSRIAAMARQGIGGAVAGGAAGAVADHATNGPLRQARTARSVALGEVQTRPMGDVPPNTATPRAAPYNMTNPVASGAVPTANGTQRVAPRVRPQNTPIDEEGAVGQVRPYKAASAHLYKVAFLMKERIHEYR